MISRKNEKNKQNNSYHQINLGICSGFYLVRKSLLALFKNNRLLNNIYEIDRVTKIIRIVNNKPINYLYIDGRMFADFEQLNNIIKKTKEINTEIKIILAIFDVCNYCIDFGQLKARCDAIVDNKINYQQLNNIMNEILKGEKQVIIKYEDSKKKIRCKPLFSFIK